MFGKDKTIAALEREFHARHDELVEKVWESLGKAGLRTGKSFAAVNAHVWEVLFPALRYDQCLHELAIEIAGAAKA